MKKGIFAIEFIFAINLLYAQETYMKINQLTGVTLSAGSTVEELSFTTTFTCGDVILYGGETYPTVQIGTQCWFARNLNIGEIVPGSANQSNNNIIEKYCYYDSLASCITYGGLYQWNEAMQYVTNEGAKGICPVGWHIPTVAEFQTLSSAVGGDGNALKEIGQGTGGGAGTNTSGFSVLLAGIRDFGYFIGLGYTTYFWSSTEYNATGAYYLLLYSYASNVHLYGGYKVYGFSVRCLKD